MKLGSPRGMDTKRPRGSERSKPCHESQLTRRSQPPYPWPPEQAQPDVSKPCRSTAECKDREGETVGDRAQRFSGLGGGLNVGDAVSIQSCGRRQHDEEGD